LESEERSRNSTPMEEMAGEMKKAIENATMSQNADGKYCNREEKRAIASLVRSFLNGHFRKFESSQKVDVVNLLKFSSEINLAKVSRIGSWRLTKKVLLAGVLFRPIKSRERGVEGWPPAIRVRGPVPPAGLFKASAAYSSPTCGDLYAALALTFPAPHSPGFAAVHRPNRHLTLDLTRVRSSHIRYLPICRASRTRSRLAPPRQKP
jgi:hypothetical protein